MFNAELWRVLKIFQSGEGKVFYNTTVKANPSLDEEGYFEQIWATLVEKINVT
jgi:hypothetical protein